MENFKPSFVKKETPKETNSQEERVIEIINLVELISNEKISFPGIKTESYEKIKAEDEEFPGFTTPIDEILSRLEQEGMKIVLGKNPQSGNVFILPTMSNDIEMDSIRTCHLSLDNVTSENLKKLIQLTTKN